jgi:hypothetical protein
MWDLVGVAMPIRSFVEPGAFDPEAIAEMSEALEAALKELQGTGEPDVVRERIATRIIAAAKLVSVIRLACWQRLALKAGTFWIGDGPVRKTHEPTQRPRTTLVQVWPISHNMQHHLIVSAIR